MGHAYAAVLGLVETVLGRDRQCDGPRDAQRPLIHVSILLKLQEEAAEPASGTRTTQ